MKNNTGDYVETDNLVRYISTRFDKKTGDELYQHIDAYGREKDQRCSKERAKRRVYFGIWSILGLLTLAGVSKSNSASKRFEEYTANPTNVSERIERNGAGIEVYSPRYHHSNQAYIADVDSNQTADAISGSEGLEFYTADYKKARPNENYEGTIEMSPEIRELATRHLNNGKDLSRAIYEAHYRVKLPVAD